MSKGKYKRKRDNAAKRAVADASKAELHKEETVSPSNERQPREDFNDERNNGHGDAVSIREVLKRSSVTDWCLALFTLALTVTAIFQYVLTANQLDVMRSDERAWIQMKGRKDPSTQKIIAPLVAEGKPLEWLLTMSNVGKTPAKNIHMVFSVQLMPANQETPLSCVLSKEAICPRNGWAAGSIFPNADSEQSVFAHRINGLGEEAKVSATEASSWLSGDAYETVFGVAYYEDVFKVQHWSRFCFWNNNADGPQKTYATRSCADFNNDSESQLISPRRR